MRIVHAKRKSVNVTESVTNAENIMPAQSVRDLVKKGLRRLFGRRINIDGEMFIGKRRKLNYDRFCAGTPKLNGGNSEHGNQN